MGVTDRLRRFFALEAAGGLLLVAAAALAMLLANSPLSGLYDGLLDVPVEIRVGHLQIAKPLLLWINDGLMAVFFLQVGLEIKREVLVGELSRPGHLTLPAVAAAGGMIAPAGVYVALNWGNAQALEGWAIPTATDIAFALGILSLLGSRVPVALKLFLMTLAIIDDLGAIVIIALFYTSELAPASLLLAASALAGLVALNRAGVGHLGPYAVLGVLLWICVLKSGVHATLAGVALAFALPMDRPGTGHASLLGGVEASLAPWVAFGIIPLFAFGNAGVSLSGLSVQSFLDPVPLGIVAGLVLGKQAGVLLFSWLAVRLGFASQPAGVSWGALYGAALLCGVGFTMSLFIGSLAFEHGADYATHDRLGILTGSLLSAVAGYLWLRFVLPARAEAQA